MGINKNELVVLAQRLREYVGNPHHINPMSDGFKLLIAEVCAALSERADNSAQAMTTNQTIDGVPRGLLERLLNAGEWQKLDFERSDSPFKVGIVSTVNELRALLDAPTALGEIDLTPKRLAHAEGVIEQQNNLIASLRAELVESYRTVAQPQGEPVAWVECSPAWLESGGDCATAPRLCIGREGISHMHPAHAEQPVPVAVLLPGKRTNFDYKYLGDDGYVAAKEWNACLDEVTRLNPSL
ncbi:hypothetical protein HZF02_17120 [Pseudomonas yamanorum]|nr:hypothetical protein HZF02_17120 [Pseudomonas yamanorum]